MPSGAMRMTVLPPVVFEGLTTSPVESMADVTGFQSARLPGASDASTNHPFGVMSVRIAMSPRCAVSASIAPWLLTGKMSLMAMAGSIVARSF